MISHDTTHVRSRLIGTASCCMLVICSPHREIVQRRKIPGSKDRLTSSKAVTFSDRRKFAVLLEPVILSPKESSRARCLPLSAILDKRRMRNIANRDQSTGPTLADWTPWLFVPQSRGL